MASTSKFIALWEQIQHLSGKHISLVSVLPGIVELKGERMGPLEDLIGRFCRVQKVTVPSKTKLRIKINEETGMLEDIYEEEVPEHETTLVFIYPDGPEN